MLLSRSVSRFLKGCSPVRTESLNRRRNSRNRQKQTRFFRRTHAHNPCPDRCTHKAAAWERLHHRSGVQAEVAGGPCGIPAHSKSDKAMNIGSVLIRFALDTLWVWVFGLAILLFLRAMRRKPLFAEKDWLALCGHTRAEVFSRRLLLRFLSLLVLVNCVWTCNRRMVCVAWCRVGTHCVCRSRWGSCP